MVRPSDLIAVRFIAVSKMPQALQTAEPCLELSEQSLNYGDAVNGAYMLGHPRFLQGLAKFLEGQYQTSVDPKTLMSTVGASMGTDLAFRAHGKAGDICVFEEPTYFLAFTMARNSGLEL
ncbi:unnamed protein product, partial [Symbiodinium sp. KB8]